MKKIAALSLLAAAVLAAPAAQAAEGLSFLPITKPGFQFAPTVALTINSNDSSQGGTADAWGLDVNFNCGLIQTADRRMRTHLNISQSDSHGVKVTGYELSPRYTVPFGDGMSAGVGPSLAMFTVDGGSSTTLYGVGLAAGVNYRQGKFYAGADLRIHSTGSNGGVDYDPTTLGLKVGMNF